MKLLLQATLPPIEQTGCPAMVPTESFRLPLAACLLSMLPILTGSCLNGGGRYEDHMWQGKTLYQEPVLPWQPRADKPVPSGLPEKNTALSYCRWLPPSSIKTRGIIIAVPGLDQSCVEWTPMGLYLAARGYEVYASDLRGQGKDYVTAGRGNYHDWRQWVEDVNDFAHQMRGRRNLPVAYVGQSLGALVAASAAAEAKDTGFLKPTTVVLHSPVLALVYPPMIARPSVATLQVLSLNQSRMTTPAILEATDSSIMSNAADEKTWETSPDRVWPGFSPRYFSACLDIGRHMRDVPARLHMPVLIQHGESDQAMKLARRSPAQFCDMFANSSKLWKHPNEAAGHDMLNDRQMCNALLEKMSHWLAPLFPAR